MEANSILLEKMYVDIIDRFAHLENKSLLESLDIFYNSKTYKLIKSGIGDYHCRSVIYLTQDLLDEYYNKI